MILTVCSVRFNKEARVRELEMLKVSYCDIGEGIQRQEDRNIVVDLLCSPIQVTWFDILYLELLP